MNTTQPKQKPTTPSESRPSAQPVTPPTSTPSVSPVDSGATSNSAKSKSQLEFVIILRSKQGTLHPMMNPRLGVGAMLTFEDIEQAIAYQQSTPVCMKHECFIVGVGGE